MARVKKLAFGILMTLALCGCTCTLAGCTSAEAKTGQESRFEVEFYESHGSAFALDYMAVDLITDTETGRQWMAVCTSRGVALAPLEEE